MIRTGSVVSLAGDIAQVLLDDTACSRCEKGQGCAIRLLPNKQAPVSIDCVNSALAQLDDHVEISVDLSSAAQARVYSVYLLPVFGLVVGAVVGSSLASLLSSNSQLLPSLGAITGFAGGLFAYPSYNCEQRVTDLQGLNPRISRVLAGKTIVASELIELKPARTSADI